MQRIVTKLLTIIGILIVALQSVSGQEADKLGSWYVYNGFINFSPKLELFVESQLRTWEPISNIQNLFFRPYLSYNFTPDFQFGYMYISRPSAPGLHRLQFFLTQRFATYN